MSTDFTPIAPAIVLEPSIRERIARWYVELAQVERDELHCPEREQRYLEKAAALRYGGEIDLSVLLEVP